MPRLSTYIAARQTKIAYSIMHDGKEIVVGNLIHESVHVFFEVISLVSFHIFEEDIQVIIAIPPVTQESNFVKIRLALRVSQPKPKIFGYSMAQAGSRKRESLGNGAMGYQCLFDMHVYSGIGWIHTV